MQSSKYIPFFVPSTRRGWPTLIHPANACNLCKLLPRSSQQHFELDLNCLALTDSSRVSVDM